MRRLMIVAAAVLMLEASSRAQTWQPPTSLNGSYCTQVSARGNTPNGPAETTLTVSCYPGKKGYVVFGYIVRGAFQMKGFDFGDFEGPDAPAMNKRLLTVRVRTSHGDIVARQSVTGGHTDGNDPDAFEFRFGIIGPLRGNTSRLINALRRGATKISLSIRGYRDKKKTIHTDFLATGASDTVTAIMKSCGK